MDRLHYDDRNSEESSQHNNDKEFSDHVTNDSNYDPEKPDGIRGRGRGRQRQELRLLHGQNNSPPKKLLNEKEHRHPMDDMEDEERFEDEEVDVDDLPPDVRKTTLQQRQQQKQREEAELKGHNETNNIENHLTKLPMQENNRFQDVASHHKAHPQTQPQVMNHEMDNNALVDSLVDSLINDDDEDDRDPTSTMPKIGSTDQTPSISSPASVPSSTMVHPDRIRQPSNHDTGILASGGGKHRKEYSDRNKLQTLSAK